jgi:hypothetical protein
MKWVEYVPPLGETRNAHKDVMRKPELKKQVRRPISRQDGIKMGVKDKGWGGGGVGGSYMTQNGNV